MGLALACSGCGRPAEPAPFVHRCGGCGEALEIEPVGDEAAAALRPAFGAAVGHAPDADAGDAAVDAGQEVAPDSSDSVGDPTGHRREAAGVSSVAGSLGVAGGIWRWASVLPEVDEPMRRRVGMGAGSTPLLRADRVAAAVSCAEVWLKDESRNPTGSFKDRGSELAVAFLGAAGLEHVGTVSTGNMARSVAAYAARAGLRATIWVGAETAASKLAPILVHGARLLRVEAPYGEIQKASLEWGRAHGVAFINSDAALRVEGQRTIAFEVAEQLDGVPHWMLVPTSSGGNLSAIARGFQDAVRFGWVERMPRLVAVQAAGCAPIARAWERGSDVPAAVGAPRTIAGAISNPTPPSGARALRWLRRCEGAAVAVDDERIVAAQQRLAALAGRFVQPASAASLAGLEVLRERGEISSSDRVVLLLTGAGSNAPPPDLAVPEAVSLEEALRPP